MVNDDESPVVNEKTSLLSGADDDELPTFKDAMSYFVKHWFFTLLVVVIIILGVVLPDGHDFTAYIVPCLPFGVGLYLLFTNDFKRDAIPLKED